MRAQRSRVIMPLLAMLLLAVTPSLAKPPQDKPGGGGGGGGSTAAYSIIPFAPDGVQIESSGVVGLNDVGEVVGVVETANGTVSYYLDLGFDVYTDLPGRVWSINNSGEIVGTILVDNEPTVGFFLSSSGADLLPLPPLPGDIGVYAYSINESRMIVGGSIGTDYAATAVIWRPILDADGTWNVDGPIPLPALDGSTYSTAIDVNDPIGGGPFQILSSGSPAAIWTIGLNPDGTLGAPSAPVSLGTLDGIPLNAWGINFLGDVCGSSGYVPFFKPFDGPAQQLQVIRRTEFGRAMAINDLGQCVGNIRSTQGPTPGFLTDDAYLWPGMDANPINLEQLIDKDSGWDDLNYADHINNIGVIAGSGYFNGESTGFFGFIMIPNP